MAKISRHVARAPSIAPGHEQSASQVPTLLAPGRGLAGTWSSSVTPLLRFLLVLLFAFGLMYIYLSQLSTVANITYQIDDMKVTATVLEHTNAQLAGQVAAQNAPGEIEQAARARGMVPAATPVFVAAPGSAAPANAGGESGLAQPALP
jgi:hypothetical protein